MAKQNSVNLDITNNADGFDISGGTTTRKLTVSGADVSITGSGTATMTFPSTTTTLAGLGITQAFTTFQSFNAGVSAQNLNVVGGTTFNSNITLNGQTLASVVSLVNGRTADVGTAMIHMGYTSAAVRVFTYPDGVTTTGSKTPLYQPYQTYQILNTAATLTANRTYFTPHVAVRPISLKTLQFVTANTGVTGNCYFSVWSADPLTGFPNTRLYVSASTAIGSGYSAVQVTNAGGLVSVPAGPFFIAVSVSSTPYVYCMSMLYVPPLFGSGNMTSGYNMAIPVIDTNGFTAPSSRTQSGTTFGFIDYTEGGAYRQGVFVEFGVV